MTSFVCKATAPTEIYTSRTTLPLHDALPICPLAATFSQRIPPLQAVFGAATPSPGDRPYASADRAKDTQIAGFGQIDWRATEQLTLTLGGRVARTKFSFANMQDGPINFGPSKIGRASCRERVWQYV